MGSNPFHFASDSFTHGKGQIINFRGVIGSQPRSIAPMTLDKAIPELDHSFITDGRRMKMFSNIVL
jgi:hypothetical protein